MGIRKELHYYTFRLRNKLIIIIIIMTLKFLFRKLGLELVPRRGAEAVDPEDISLVELYRDHVESAERAAAVSHFYPFG